MNAILGMEENEELVLLLQGSGSEQIGLHCPLGNPMTLPLLVLDLPLRRGLRLLQLAFRLETGLAFGGRGGGGTVGTVGVIGATSMASRQSPPQADKGFETEWTILQFWRETEWYSRPWYAGLGNKWGGHA
jgi:hypothetical protein